MYLADINNLVHITPLKVTLALGLDFYRVLSSITKELYEEFKFVDKSETEYNYWNKILNNILWYILIYKLLLYKYFFDFFW